MPPAPELGAARSGSLMGRLVLSRLLSPADTMLLRRCRAGMTWVKWPGVHWHDMTWHRLSWPVLSCPVLFCLCCHALLYGSGRRLYPFSAAAPIYFLFQIFSIFHLPRASCILSKPALFACSSASTGLPSSFVRSFVPHQTRPRPSIFSQPSPVLSSCEALGPPNTPALQDHRRTPTATHRRRHARPTTP